MLYALPAAGLRLHRCTHNGGFAIPNHLMAATAGGMPGSCGALQRLSHGGDQSVPEDYVLQDANHLLGYADRKQPHPSHFCYDACIHSFVRSLNHSFVHSLDFKVLRSTMTIGPNALQ